MRVGAARPPFRHLFFCFVVRATDLAESVYSGQSAPRSGAKILIVKELDGFSSPRGCLDSRIPLIYASRLVAGVGISAAVVGEPAGYFLQYQSH